MVRFALIAFLSLLCSCTNKESSLSEEEKVGYQAIFDYGKKIQNRGVQVVGFGGESREDKTQVLDVTFSSNIELTIPVARKLIIELVDGFLKEINQNEKLRPCLADYPFTVNNVRMSVLGKKGKDDSDLLFSVSFQDAEISYRKDNPNGGLLITILEETYEEASHKL